MANPGWVTVPRSLRDSPIWPVARKLTEVEFFLWMKFRANHTPKVVLHKGKLINICRGQFATSLDKLREATNGRSKGWIRRRLEIFTDVGLIKHEKSYQQFTMITICNYDDYENGDGSEPNAKPTPKPISEPTQYNNGNNVNKIYSAKPKKINKSAAEEREYDLKIQHIVDAVSDHLRLDCSRPQAGEILRAAGQENIGEALKAIQLSKGQLDDSGKFIGMVKYQLQRRGLWSESDQCEAKTITSRFNEKIKDKHGIEVSVSRR